MKIIFNKYIPFKGFLAINLFGVLFVRKRENGLNPVLSKSTINHEKIHTATRSVFIVLQAFGSFAGAVFPQLHAVRI